MRRSAALGSVLLLAALVNVTPARAASSSQTFSQPATWNSALVDAAGAAALGNGGSGVTVAVLDTWIDEGHPEFGGRALPGADCASGTCTPGPAASDGCDPHGTHVAGIVGSKDYGIAPAATILPVRVLAGASNATCSATPQAVAAGISYAMNAGARVINVSLGGDGGPGATMADATIDAAVHTAAQAGDLVIFAAGNSGGTAAQFDEAVIVGSVGPSGTLASYSASGATLLAPGGDTHIATTGRDCSTDVNSVADCILSTWFCSANPSCAALDQGTSMAAPMVAGLGALLFAQNPGRSLADAEAAIDTTAHRVSGAAYGLIDVCHAMLYGSAATSCPSTTSPQTGTTTSTAPARKFVGCPKSLTVAKGKKPTIKCRIMPRQGGVVIAVQKPKGKSWVTTYKIKTARDGSLRALGPIEKKPSKVRLLIGRLSVTIAIKIK